MILFEEFKARIINFVVYRNSLNTPTQQKLYNKKTFDI